MKIWCKLVKENTILRDTVIEINDYSMTRTAKVYKALEDVCYAFDLEKPLWLASNKNDFICHARTRFSQDSFIEQISFDFLDFEVLEEDE